MCDPFQWQDRWPAPVAPTGLLTSPLPLPLPPHLQPNPVLSGCGLDGPWHFLTRQLFSLGSA